MAINVLLVRVDSKLIVPRRVVIDVVDDTKDFLEQAVWMAKERNLPTLGKLEPYDDVTLKSEQMPQLISDLSVLIGDENLEVRKQHLARVMQIARKCQEEKGSRLEFLGD